MNRPRRWQPGVAANPANLLTGLRLAMVPALVWLVAEQAWRPALVLFVVAAATDYGDGRLARSYGTASSAGRWFDHLTDIALLVSLYSALAAGGLVPVAVPVAIAASFSFYGFDALVGSRYRSQLASRLGHFGGVANYVILGGLLVDFADIGVGLHPLLRAGAVALIPVYSMAAVAARLVAGRLPE